MATIPVIDDFAGMRQSLVMAPKDAGYDAVEAVGSTAGLQRVEE